MLYNAEKLVEDCIEIQKRNFEGMLGGWRFMQAHSNDADPRTPDTIGRGMTCLVDLMESQQAWLEGWADIWNGHLQQSMQRVCETQAYWLKETERLNANLFRTCLAMTKQFDWSLLDQARTQAFEAVQQTLDSLGKTEQPQEPARAEPIRTRTRQAG